MGQFFSQVFTLLTSETGSLAFHLVLAFSVLGAFQITISHSKGEFNPVSRRLALGLAGLLVLQLLLFLVSALGWQGLVNSDKLLPPLDRATILLSTILIVWMWISLQPTRLADTIMLVLMLLVATASVLACVWWINQPAGQDFNFSTLDVIAQGTQILLLVAGGLLLLVTRPPGWSTGLTMLGLMLLGPVLHFLFHQVEGDYSGAVRLSLMAAFPFLLYLPQHIPVSEPEQEASAESEARLGSSGEERDLAVDTPFLQLLGQMVLENDPDSAARTVVASMADFANSDICLLAKIKEDEAVAVVTCGFDRIKGAYLEKIALPIQDIPVFASSYRLGRVRKLKLSGNSPEIAHLTRALDLQETGNVLFMPVLSPNGQPLSGLIFLNPYSETDWTTGEQSTLHLYARALVYLLQRSEERLAATEEIGQAQTMLRLVQEQAQINSFERQKLLDQLLVIQQESSKAGPLSWSVGNGETADLFGEPPGVHFQPSLEEGKPVAQLEGDLRMALQEIIRLRADLAEIESQAALEPVGTPTRLPSLASNHEMIGSIAQDIQESAGSIAENQRLLSAEAVHLEASQRKYLERIGIAASRLSHLAGELVLQSGLQTEAGSASLEELDLLDVVDQVLQAANPRLEAGKIDLQREFPTEPLLVHSSKSILQSVFADLLQNAISASGEQGRIIIRLKLERAEGKQDYVLAQISDSGAGLDDQEQARVFSPPASIIEAQPEEINFAAIRFKIESLQGKIWLDSEIGKGTVFSLLIPVSGGEFDEPPTKDVDT